MDLTIFYKRLLIAFFLSSICFADPFQIALTQMFVQKQCQEIFSNMYAPRESGGLYRCNHCDQNMSLLLEKFKEISDFDTGVAKLLLIKRKKDWLIRLNGKMLRSGKPVEWYYHFVLEYRGMIYDFDFMDTPTVTTASNYFEKMFGKGHRWSFSYRNHSIEVQYSQASNFDGSIDSFQDPVTIKEFLKMLDSRSLNITQIP